MAVISLIAMMLFPFFCLASSAQLTIFSDKEYLNIGDTVVITVNFDSSEALDFVGASITYDHNRLEFIEGGGRGVQISNGTGEINGFSNENTNSFEYSFVFIAKSEGTAYFRLRNCEALSFYSGENILTTETKRIVLTIGESSGEPDENEPSLPPTENNLNPDEPILNESNTIEIYGTLYNVIKNSMLSNIMTESEHTINGINYTAYIGESKYLLLENEGFEYLYDINSMDIFPMIINTNSFVLIPLELSDTNKINININEYTVNALPTESEDFFKVYCINGHGEKSWYYYDALEGTFQAIDDQSSVPPVEPQINNDNISIKPDQKNVETSPIWIIVFAVIIITLTTLIIITVSKRR